MSENQSLLIKSNDYLKISDLVALANEEVQDLLQTELDRATIVEETNFPSNVVSMNSTIVYLDLETNIERRVTLVYPHESDISKNRISILAPIGAALIGLKVGQHIRWPLRPHQEKQIKVVEVISSD